MAIVGMWLGFVVDAARTLRRHTAAVEQQQGRVAADAAQIDAARERAVALSALHAAVRLVGTEVDDLRHVAHQVRGRDRRRDVHEFAAQRNAARADDIDAANAAAGYDQLFQLHDLGVVLRHAQGWQKGQRECATHEARAGTGRPWA